MRARTILVIGMLMLMAVPGNALSQFTKVKIAVLDFDLEGENFETKDLGRIVAEWFVTELVKTGRFDVIERALLDKILKEQKLGMAGLLDESTAARIGKLLGVKVIISGSVLKLKENIEINARIVDVETASIIVAERVQSATANQLDDLVVDISEKIVKRFPLKGYVVWRKDNHVAIDLGSEFGVRPGMRFAAYRAGEEIKHPRTGEVLDVERIQTGSIRVTRVRDRASEGIILAEEEEDPISRGQFIYSLDESQDSTHVRSGLARPHLNSSPNADSVEAGNQISIREVQSELERLGFYFGKVDGEWGPNSKSAANDYARMQDRNIERIFSKEELGYMKTLPDDIGLNVDLSKVFAGFSCDVMSYGGSWAKETRERIRNDMYSRYGCSLPPGSAMKPGFRGDFHAPASRNGPWQGFAWTSMVLYYDMENRHGAEAVARDLSNRYGHEFITSKGGGQGILPDFYDKAIVVHVREKGF